MDWHKQNAARRANIFRRYKAHIYESVVADRTLCGRHHSKVNVYINTRDINAPDVNVCKHCKRVSDYSAL